MSELSGSAKCVKYTLFVFNLLFLLAGLALIIVGAVVQVQTSKATFGGTAGGAGIFIIVIGSVIFLVCFFGCAGAINNNYCMVVTFGVLLLVILLAQIAAVITGFVMKDKFTGFIKEEMMNELKAYTPGNNTAVWDNTQKTFKCCGLYNYTAWSQNQIMKETDSLPDSCCVNSTIDHCGRGQYSDGANPLHFYQTGCETEIVDLLKHYLIAVGAVAAAVALLEIIGVIFAFCLAGCLRKDYRVV
jgi:CD63 antigen